MTPDVSELARRHVHFEQWFNVRDLGGYVAGETTVAWKRFYRAGAPSRLSPSDLERVGDLGLTTVIDLRRDEEAARDEKPAVEALRAAYHRLPVMASQDAMDGYATGATISAERYLAFLEVGGEAFRGVFEILGDPAAYPVVVHCTAGKDRTGVVSAMTLELLGVPRDAIEADYAMNNLERERIAAFWLGRGGSWYAQATPAQRDFALSVPLDVIGGFLDWSHARYGGAEAYLRGVGVPAKSITGLRQVLCGTI